MLDWRGSFAKLLLLLGSLRDVCERVCLQVDVSADGVLGPIGIEIVSTESAPHKRHASDARLFAQLASTGLCSPLESARLLEWPSFQYWTPDLIASRVVPANGIWERSLDGGIVTALHHVKFKFDCHGEIETKAYFVVYIMCA
ncbi:MAG: hypothetical protein IAI50_01055 [Candidatus Eremiobacteraeota bacterium]|nr:hypothetical protein [Candidatus Eremiobacteraeota bacterium]